MDEQNKRKKIFPLKIERGKNYYLFQPDYFFREFNNSQIELLNKILDIQKIEPLQLKDLIECEGALRNNPLDLEL
jgi:hypothetical protein